jgi:hypothetical protein
MNRRLFLGSLLASAILDPDKLLWRPGAKLISIPKPLATRGWGTPGRIRPGDSFFMGGKLWVVVEPQPAQMVFEGEDLIGIEQRAIAQLATPTLPRRFAHIYDRQHDFDLVCDPP